MTYTLRFAGAESNFAVALARLGVRVTWVSRLGRDSFGDMIEAGLAEEGIDLSWVQRDDAPTGLYYKSRHGGRTEVSYRRAGSAASRLGIGDVPGRGLRRRAFVHLTGITMAISDSARELVLEVARRARRRGAIVIFDPNFRPALPDTPEAAAARHSTCCPRRLVPLRGERGTSPRRRTGALGGVRVGARGAILDGVEVTPQRTATIVDEIGAGDAFAAGFAYGLLEGWEPHDCVRAANVIAAYALAGTGDRETLPRLEDVRGGSAVSRVVISCSDAASRAITVVGCHAGGNRQRRRRRGTAAARRDRRRADAGTRARRLAAAAADPRAARFRTPAGLRERWAVRFSVVQPDARAASMAGMRFLASFPPTLQGCGIARRTLVASAGGWVGGSDGGSRGPDLAPLWVSF